MFIVQQANCKEKTNIAEERGATKCSEQAHTSKIKILHKIALFCLINQFQEYEFIVSEKALPHAIAIVVFLIVSFAFNKTALEGKMLRQADVQGYTGMAKQSRDFKEKYGHYPLWTESMFSGMPAYNIAMDATSNITIGYLNRLFVIGPKPVYFFFIACICFYMLTQVYGLSLLVSILGSIAYAFATFNPILAAVGHETELIAIGYMPAIVAGLLLILRGRYLGGTALMALFLGLQISSQHLQIVYYTGLIIAVIAIVYLALHWKNEKPRHLVIAGALVAAALVIGMSNYAVSLLPTKEYALETMRGGRSQLTATDAKNKTKGGLDKEYAFRWSYGIAETFTLFVPGMQGGGSEGREISDNSKFAEKLTEVGVPEDNALAIANSSIYWGDQPGTAGPVYLGAVICFLFILGMVYVKSWHKWWILVVSSIGIVLAWGRHFEAVNYFLFDHLPFYSKFRAPSMALVMPQLGFALLAVLGLQEFTGRADTRVPDFKEFRKVLYATGALLLLTLIVFFSSDFKSVSDAQVKNNFASNIAAQMAQGKQPTPEIIQQADQVVNGWMAALRDDRKGVFQTDLIRSFIFVLLAAALCWMYVRKKIKPVVLISALLVLSSFDLIAEGKKYLKEENYTEAENIDAFFTMTNADNQIHADPDQNFRVLDMTEGDPFSSAHASYYHNSIGGYHPAKLGLYNDLIERQLTKGNQMVFNMLNTKYIIRKGQDGKEIAQLNTGAFGPCWLVSHLHFVQNPDQEMAALDSINVRDTAIIEAGYKNKIPFEPVPDSSASIRLIENLNDQIRYQVKAGTNQFAVFSEIYYDKGWNAFIDGKPAPSCRVDYVLRGMAVPAGDHTIEFRFEPKSYQMGNTISVWGAVVTYLLLIAALLQAIGLFPKKKNTTV